MIAYRIGTSTVIISVVSFSCYNSSMVVLTVIAILINSTPCSETVLTVLTVELK